MMVVCVDNLPLLVSYLRRSKLYLMMSIIEDEMRIYIPRKRIVETDRKTSYFLSLFYLARQSLYYALLVR